MRCSLSGSSLCSSTITNGVFAGSRPVEKGRDDDMQRPVLFVGGALTAASMAWTAWSVVDMVSAVTPLPVAIAVATGVELSWLAMVAVEWAHAQRGQRVPRALAAAGWATVAVVVAVLTLHGIMAGW